MIYSAGFTAQNPDFLAIRGYGGIEDDDADEAGDARGFPEWGLPGVGAMAHGQVQLFSIAMACTTAGVETSRRPARSLPGFLGPVSS